MAVRSGRGWGLKHVCSYKRGGEELSERCKVEGELRG